MRKYLIVTLLAALVSVAGYSQVLNTNTAPPTLTGPGMEALSFLSTATNWIVAPFLEYSPQAANDKYGGGLAAVINLNESQTLATMLRVDYVGASWWMPSANLQLQFPIHIGSNVTVTPFGFGGASVPLGGKDQNTIAGIFGSGLDIKLNKLSKHWSIAADVEYWTNMPGPQYRFSPFVYRF